MLETRKKSVLRAIVEEYIATAQPIGSRHLASTKDLSVSSATVRNDMAALERQGFLTHTHTSAGRIPTDKGFRFFVDCLVQEGSQPREIETVVGSFFESAHFQIEETLRRTSELLVQLTKYASVVIGPSKQIAVVKAIQLVRLSNRIVTAVVVLSSGAVESEQLETGTELTDDQLSIAEYELRKATIDHTLSSTSERKELFNNCELVIKAFCLRVLAVFDRSNETYYYGGVAQMTEAFNAVDVVRDVVRTLEQQFVIVRLIRDLLSRGVSVAIGKEHGIEQLASCSVVLAPVVSDGNLVGTVGVLGPTRMDYEKAIAAVDAVGLRLGDRLTRTSG